MAGLSNRDIFNIVNRYIGVNGGYLGDFSYRTHQEFYLEYCGLDINPNAYEGTTRIRFMTILEKATPDVQAKIVRGVLARFPLGSATAPETRTPELAAQLTAMAERLDGLPVVAEPNPQLTSDVVERAIGDAKILIDNGRPASAVDRVHTALHGYLRAVCDDAGIAYTHDDGMGRLLRLLRQRHPALHDLGPRPQEIERILQAFAQVMDALNPIRNNASVAHPNENILANDEACLVINAALTLLHYLDRKFGI